MMSQRTFIIGNGKTTRKLVKQKRYKGLREMSESDNVEIRNDSKEKTEIRHMCTRMRGRIKNSLHVCVYASIHVNYYSLAHA